MPNYKILRANHWAQISALISSQIERLDEYESYDPENDSDGDEDLTGSTTDGGTTKGINNNAGNNANNNIALPSSIPSTLTFRSGDHFILGSYLGLHTIGKLIEKSAGDAAFTSFPARLSIVIKKLSPTDAVVIDETFKVCNYHEFAFCQTYVN